MTSASSSSSSKGIQFGENLFFHADRPIVDCYVGDGGNGKGRRPPDLTLYLADFPWNNPFCRGINLKIMLFEERQNEGDKSDNNRSGLEFGEGEDNHHHLSLKVKCVKDEHLCRYKFCWDQKAASAQQQQQHPLLKDTFWLGGGRARWYGGAYMMDQRWPIPKSADPLYDMRPFVLNDVTQTQTSGQERYWLSSTKMLLFVPQRVPLWTELRNGHLKFQTTMDDWCGGSREGILCLPLEYSIVVPRRPAETTLCQFQMLCARKYLLRIDNNDADFFPPPDLLLIKRPIWSTWAHFKTGVDQQNVVDFAGQLMRLGFPVSQLELDDGWASAYGDFAFDPLKFPNPSEMVRQLKQLGIPRLTLWVHPFVNKESENGRNDELGRKFWLKTLDGRIASTRWWNGEAFVIDVISSPEARKWFKQQLDALRNLGIFSFKFDAGECSSLPANFHLSGSNSPNAFGRAYARFAAQFPASEVRFGCGSQGERVIVRMMDRNSHWSSEEGGLGTVISWVLTMSLHGYYWVLPDMIGGNGQMGSGEPPEEELYIRWIQVNTFLPILQFSYPPWHENFDKGTVVEICKSMLALREKWMKYILECVNKAVEDREPVVRPIWWIFESDEAFDCCDQFLLGNVLMVCPVTKKGEISRDVLIPPGTWQNELDGMLVEGPKTINVQVPLDKLSHFSRVGITFEIDTQLY